MGKLRALLVTMPLAEPLLPNLAIEQLAEIIRKTGATCDVFYGTLCLPAATRFELIHSLAGPAIFAPQYRKLKEEEYFSQVANSVFEQSQIDEEEFADKSNELFIELSIGAKLAQDCIEQCMAEIPAETYDIVGFSIGFDAQKLASAVLARRLKEREPSLKIIAGGTGCDGAMGPALLQAFCEFDAVIQGEAENLIVPAMVATVNGLVSHSPAILQRDSIQYGGPTSVEATSLPEVSTAPEPNYDSFIHQRRIRNRGERPLSLMLETSRGCWWGAKHHCTFCGIKSVNDPYRTLPADEAVRRIMHLHNQYKPDLIYCTDSILDYKYFRDVLPELARIRSSGIASPCLFFEVKSNLRREQVALLAAAGVVRVQPGIESFNSRVLKLIKKGASGLQQIAMLKWCATYRIGLVYGLLVGVPGETHEDLEVVTGLMGGLSHLPAPLSVNPLGLHKFSPYSNDPESFGFSDISPFPVQHLIYGIDDPRLLSDLCYELAYSLPQFNELKYKSALAEFRNTVVDWQMRQSAGEMLTVAYSHDGHGVIVRVKNGGLPEVIPLTGWSGEMYQFASEPVSLESVARTFHKDDREVLATIDWFRNRGLLAVLDEHILALALPAEADAVVDSQRLMVRSIPIAESNGTELFRESL